MRNCNKNFKNDSYSRVPFPSTFPRMVQYLSPDNPQTLIKKLYRLLLKWIFRKANKYTINLFVGI